MSADSDIALDGAALDERSKERRAHNRESSADILNKAGVPFTTNNGGVHLIVAHGAWLVDFWPGTGLWRAHLSHPDQRKFHSKGRGVFSMLKLIWVPKP